MKRALLAAATLLALSACGSRAPNFTQVSITLPEDDGSFPAHPGVEAITANCSACHSPSMILNQPRLTRAQWQSTITKMREVYKASIDPTAEPAILGYLDAVSAGGAVR
jgi:hypothetical protein